MSGFLSRLFRQRAGTDESPRSPPSSEEGTPPRNRGVPHVREVALAIDDAAILAVAAKIAASDTADFTPEELAIVAALRRAHPTAGQSTEELGSWLAGMDSHQLRGVVSNTKGVLHEMLFVELENADGDTVHAAQFPATNHPGFDVSLVDETAGDRWVAQLKATDSESYVREWLDAHPGGEILVTDEIARRLGIAGSGFSNAELTTDTSRLVDHLLEADDQDTLWEHIPALGALSLALALAELHERTQRGEIGREQFMSTAAQLAGQSVARKTGLAVLMAIPGLNVLAATGLVARNLERSGVLEKANHWLTRKSAQVDATRAYELAVYTERMVLEHGIGSARSERESARFLDGKTEEFRQAYAANLRDMEEAFSEVDPPAARELLEYQDPERLAPDPCQQGTAAQMVDEKLARVRAERAAFLLAAREFLRDPANIGPFRRSLEKLVGEDGAAAIERAIATA